MPLIIHLITLIFRLKLKYVLHFYVVVTQELNETYIGCLGFKKTNGLLKLNIAYACVIC